jgi:uncharacterized protein
MGQMKTPGVYIVEKSAFPNSIVEAPTAIPAFIGITEKAQNGADSLSGKPWKITSMTEFQQYFGGAPTPEFALSVVDSPEKDATETFYVIQSAFKDDKGKAKLLRVVNRSNPYSLYYHMVMFFANGGGTCYIVSIGTYNEKDAKGNLIKVDKDTVKKALDDLKKEQEITMVVVPEAASAEDCKDIQTQVLAHCGEMMNRLAILDVQPKTSDNETMDSQIETFRTNVGANYLSYGAAYYPWLNTSVLSDKDIDGTVLTWDYKQEVPDMRPFFDPKSGFPEYFKNAFDEIKLAKRVITPAQVDETGAETAPAVTEDCTADKLAAMKNNLHNALLQNLPGYRYIVNKVRKKLNLLPPSAAMAGLYTMVDNTRGVWKAPANVSVNFVNAPTENIDNAMQEDLNMPMNGKAVNAIRTFPGEGIKVWGARTLDGNSQDWRYVNVRRTMMFLEESVKNAAKAYVFEPNVAATWMNVRSMIDNFLRSVWKRGGLAGATPEDAYEIHVGLGDTMTANDILDGIMRITVLVAITRPAEFIEITFQQQMQKS